EQGVIALSRFPGEPCLKPSPSRFAPIVFSHRNVVVSNSKEVLHVAEIKSHGRGLYRPGGAAWLRSGIRTRQDSASTSWRISAHCQGSSADGGIEKAGKLLRRCPFSSSADISHAQRAYRSRDPRVRQETEHRHHLGRRHRPVRHQRLLDGTDGI